MRHEQRRDTSTKILKTNIIFIVTLYEYESLYFKKIQTKVKIKHEQNITHIMLRKFKALI